MIGYKQLQGNHTATCNEGFVFVCVCVCLDHAEVRHATFTAALSGTPHEALTWLALTWNPQRMQNKSPLHPSPSDDPRVEIQAEGLQIEGTNTTHEMQALVDTICCG